MVCVILATYYVDGRGTSNGSYRQSRWMANEEEKKKICRLRSGSRLLEYKIFSFIYFDVSLPRENDHTMMTAPHPVRSAKLSIIGLS